MSRLYFVGTESQLRYKNPFDTDTNRKCTVRRSCEAYVSRRKSVPCRLIQTLWTDGSGPETPFRWPASGRSIWLR